MWAGTFPLGKAIGLGYDRTATLAFTAVGNNFELAIAVAIATFGVSSGQALSGVVEPLIEVPVLIGLVHVSLARRKKFSSPALTTERPDHWRPAWTAASRDRGQATSARLLGHGDWTGPASAPPIGVGRPAHDGARAVAELPGAAR